MSRGLSDLQERIILCLWMKRSRFEWKRDDSRDEWINPQPKEEWEAKFPDTSFRKWTKQQRREWGSHDNWICRLENHSGRGQIYSELIPDSATEDDRKKLQTSVARAIDRLRDRGIVASNRSGVVELTPWGSLYGWLLNEGRMTPALEAKKHKQSEPSYETRERRAFALARLERQIARTTPPHEQMIELIRELSAWERQCILNELLLMVEMDTLRPESTDKAGDTLMVEEPERRTSQPISHEPGESR